MVRLRCESPAERWLIPAFVFFFEMLYPFRWSGPGRARAHRRRGRRLRAARPRRLRGGGRLRADPRRRHRRLRAGAAHEDARADLARPDRPGRSRSAPTSFGDVRRMVARTAYAQLGYSPALLAGMVAALALVFLAPPLLALFADRGAARGWRRARLGRDGAGLRADLAPLRPLAAARARAARRSPPPTWSSPSTRPSPNGAAAAACGRARPNPRSDAALNRATAAGLKPHRSRADRGLRKRERNVVCGRNRARRGAVRPAVPPARDPLPCPRCRISRRRGCAPASAAERRSTPMPATTAAAGRSTPPSRRGPAPARRAARRWPLGVRAGGGCHHPGRIRHAPPLLRPRRSGAGGAHRPLPAAACRRARRRLPAAAGRCSTAGRSTSRAR